MSDPAKDNGGAGGNADKIPHEELIDRLELVFDRADGSMRIDGSVVSDEVVLMMLQRAVNAYTARTRAAYAMALREQALEQQRVKDLLDRTRGGR